MSIRSFINSMRCMVSFYLPGVSRKPCLPDATLTRSYHATAVNRGRTWMWNDLFAIARTKSEARAVFKRMLKLKRLPVGAVVQLAP